MSANVVKTPDISETETIIQNYSTVCDLCEGIGREAHPRSKMINKSSWTCFVYIYLHYPDLGLLRSSYERHGCQTCRLIFSCIQDESSGSVNPHEEQARCERERLASFDIAQDTYRAASLVGSANIDEKYLQEWPIKSALQIEGCGSGRVALCITCHSRRGPRLNPELNPERAYLDVVVHVFETVSMAPPLPRSMNLFCSPG